VTAPDAVWTLRFSLKGFGGDSLSNDLSFQIQHDSEILLPCNAQKPAANLILGKTEFNERVNFVE